MVDELCTSYKFAKYFYLTLVYISSEYGDPLFCPLHFRPKGQNNRGQKCTKSVFLTTNFGRKLLGQKCTKTAFLTKFSGQK